MISLSCMLSIIICHNIIETPQERMRKMKNQ